MGSRSSWLRGLPVLQQHFQGLQMVFPFRLSQKARSNPHFCALSRFHGTEIILYEKLTGGGYSGEGERWFRREGERHSGASERSGGRFGGDWGGRGKGRQPLCPCLLHSRRCCPECDWADAMPSRKTKS